MKFYLNTNRLTRKCIWNVVGKTVIILSRPHCVNDCVFVSGHEIVTSQSYMKSYVLTVFTWFHCSDIIMRAMLSQITGVSIVYLIVCSGADQRKHLRHWLLWGVTGGFPSQRTSNAQNIHSWCRHHALRWCNMCADCSVNCLHLKNWLIWEIVTQGSTWRWEGNRFDCTRYSPCKNIKRRINLYSHWKWLARAWLD